MIQNSNSSSKSSPKSIQRPKPKMLGKKGENGVSTLFVLSMRPYAHISWNRDQKGHFIKGCNLLWKALFTFNKTIPINKTY